MWKSEVTKEDLGFEISKRPLFIQKDDGEFLNLQKHEVTGTGKTTDRMAIWNDRDQQLLGVVSGKRYNAVPHGVIVDSLYEALDNLNLDATKVKITATPKFEVMG